MYWLKIQRSFEVLFENHIFYENVSSIKMIIIISSTVQKKCKRNSVFFVLCSRQNSKKFRHEISPSAREFSSSQTKFRCHLDEISFTAELEHFFTCFRQISAIVNVCLCCGNAKFRTGNLLFRSFYWRKREDTVRQPDLFFRVSVRFRYCVNTSKKFHICGNQVFQLEFFFIRTWN